jgi:fermentation-respiration switch protein FrsA (DUF1100 family)
MKSENLRILIVAILFAYTVFYLSQRSFLYHPANYRPSLEAYRATEMSEVNFKTRDGLMLHAWYKKAKPAHATLLYFHGNAGQFGSRYRQIKPYLEQGYGALLFSYRGFAGNKGSPSEHGLYKDGQAAINYLVKKRETCQVYYGESLGSGVAVELSLHNKPVGVILQSPYTSITEMARRYYPWSPLGPWDKFDSLSKIDKLNAPLLILHGKKDTLIPADHARALYQKARGDVSLKLYPNKDHNDMFGKPIEKDISVFLAKVSKAC